MNKGLAGIVYIGKIFRIARGLAGIVYCSPTNLSFIQCNFLNFEKTTFLNDQFHEIAVNDIFVQRYKQICAKIQKRIEVLSG